MQKELAFFGTVFLRECSSMIQPCLSPFVLGWSMEKQGKQAKAKKTVKTKRNSEKRRRSIKKDSSKVQQSPFIARQLLALLQ